MKELLYLTSPYVGVVIMFLFLRQIFPLKVEDWKMPLYLSPMLLGHLPKYLFGSYSSIAQMCGLATGVLGCTLFPILLLEGKKWKTIANTFFFYGLQMLADCASYGIFGPRFGYVAEDYTAIQLFCYLGTTWSVYIFVCSICVFLSRTIMMQRFQPFYFLFLIFPFSQTILVFCGVFHIMNSLWVLGVIAGLGAEIALLGYTISQEKKAALEEELGKVRHMMELEQAHYKGVEDRQEEMARIRHDFNNQLATIGQLIRQGENSDAQHMIRLLADGISNTRENTYCAIPVINAVLTEKSKACEEAGIKLEVQLDIPKELSVEPLHLCSILGNLLDNAIHGVCASGAKDPMIRLTSALDGDYLFVKVLNPSKTPIDKPVEGHGYGKRILKELSERYHGKYLAEYQNGIYTAIVTLLIQ